MEVKAKVGNKDGSSDWIETLPVSSIEKAEQEIKDIIKNFNASLRAYEKPRVFIELIGKKERNPDNQDDFLDSVKKFCGIVRRESHNAYGDRWCHHNRLKQEKLYEGLVKKGGVKRFIEFVADSPYRGDFPTITNSKLKRIK